MTDPTSAADTNDLDALLGAYALDALDAEDRARVDAYLEGDASARAEVDDMRETAASLALLPDSPAEAPPELWTRIAEVIASDRPAATATAPADGGDEVAARRNRRVRVAWMAPVAVAAAIALVFLSAQVVSLHHQLDSAHQLGSKATATAFDRAAHANGAKETGLRSGSGATLARVVLLPDGTGYLRGDHLTPLAQNQTYQLWALTGPTANPVAISAGVLGPDPTAISFRASGPVHGFAMTVEHAGGVIASHNTPIAQGALA